MDFPVEFDEDSTWDKPSEGTYHGHSQTYRNHPSTVFHASKISTSHFSQYYIWVSYNISLTV
jgi:hypothetical protein